MDHAVESLVWGRALSRCEYCQMPQKFDGFTHEIDHVIARKHRGRTIAANLALACFPCNNHKGPNIAGVDRITRRLTPLFNPRRHKWSRHFRWSGPILIGRTPIGRVTIAVLEINFFERVLLRDSLIAEGVFPPSTD
ncbi:MAG TPA: HNH endonuclease signature motif containing protein [Gemmataceae bacterium]|nr:HNH endonuclease signature motif containing protein [Gemmataceae bacterium]